VKTFFGDCTLCPKTGVKNGQWRLHFTAQKIGVKMGRDFFEIPLYGLKTCAKIGKNYSLEIALYLKNRCENRCRPFSVSKSFEHYVDGSTIILSDPGYPLQSLCYCYLTSSIK